MSNLVKALIIVAIVVAGVIVFLNSQGDPGPVVDPGSGGTPVVDDGPKPDRGGENTPVRQIPLADEKTVAITGQVLNDNDQVLSGVKILAYSMTGGTGQSNLTLVGEKVSSDVGAFQFDALRAGKYRFIARTEGYQEGRVERTLIVDQTADPIEFVLSSGLTISGKVLGITGEPIAGAEVTAFLERVRETAGLQERLQQLLKIQELQSEVGIMAVTDSSGEYQLQGLENEHYRLRVIAPRHSPATRRYVRAGSTDVDFALEIGGELTGVVRGNGGEPVSNADLYIYKQDSEDVDIIEVVLQRLYPPLAAVSTGPGGEYVFDQLGAGMEYRLVTTASGYQPVETQKIVVSTGGTTTLDLSLEKGKSISGYVYGPDGAALEGARVKVNLTGARSATPQIALTDQGVPTNADGYFIFDTLEDGEYRVVASHDAYATFQQQKVSPDTAELAITLSEGAAISGTVRDAGTGSPIAGAIITVREPAGVEKKATTDASGIYMVRGVTVPRRGEARLGCTADGYAREGNASAPVTDGSVTDGFDFAMRANGTVTGFVLDTAGAKVSGARVEVKRQNDPNMPIYVTVGGPVTSGSDGSYTIENVAPGVTSFVVASHPNYLESDSAPFDLDPGGQVPGVEVALRLGGVIEGRVVDDRGAPLEGVKVAVKDERVGDVPIDSLEKKTATDATGTFRIGSVEAGDATLVAHLDGFLRVEVSGVGVTEGRTSGGLEIQLTQGAYLSGFVLDSAGNAIVGAKVTVIDTSDGLNKPVRRTDSNGFYTFNELGRYPVQINVEKSGYSKAQLHEVPVNTENNNFELRRLGRLIGMVVNDAGEPLTTFSVAPKIHENGRTLQRQPARTFNSPNGEFEYPGINPGDYDIVVGCPGFAAATVANVRVEENVDTDLGQVRLSEGGKVGGYIIDGATGQPIVGATVTVKGGSAAMLSNPFGSNRSGNRPRRGGVVGRQRSDKEGYFMISGLAQDVVTLDIEQRNYMPQTIELQAGQLDAQITLSRGGLIEGRVTTTDKSGGGGVQLFLTGNGRSDRQVTDRKGSFTFGGLVDGNYEVRVSNFGLVGSGKSTMRDAPVYKVTVKNGVAPFLDITYDGPTGRRDEN